MPQEPSKFDPLSPDVPPGRWAVRLMKWWQEFHPDLHAQYQKDGVLTLRAKEQEHEAERAYDELRRGGMSHEQATDVAVREHLLKPDPSPTPE